MVNKNGFLTAFLTASILLVGLDIHKTITTAPANKFQETVRYVSSKFLLSCAHFNTNTGVANPIHQIPHIKPSAPNTDQPGSSQTSDPWEKISLPQTIDPAAYHSPKEYTDALYEEALTFFENQKLELPWKHIVCIGDSITAGIQSGMEPPWPISYPEVLGSLYHVPTDNAGIGASTIWSGGVEPMVRRIKDCNSADALFVMGGVNDSFDKACRIGDAETPCTFSYDLNKLFQNIREMYADSDVYIILPLEPAVEELNKDFLEEIRDTERSFAQKYGFYIMDLSENNILAPTDPDIKEAYYSDPFHPNSDGYDMLGTIIAYEAIRLKCENP